MTREQSLKQILMYGKSAAVAGVTLTDADYPGIGSAIDNAMRAIGIAEDSISNYDVPASKIQKFLAALHLYVLKMLLAGVSPDVDMSVDRANRVDKKRSQHFANINNLYNDALRNAAQYGITPGSDMKLYKLRVKDSASVRGEF